MFVRWAGNTLLNYSCRTCNFKRTNQGVFSPWHDAYFTPVVSHFNFWIEVNYINMPQFIFCPINEHLFFFYFFFLSNNSPKCILVLASLYKWARPSLEVESLSYKVSILMGKSLSKAIFVKLYGVKLYLSVILFCVPLTGSGTEYIIIFLLTIWIFSFENCLH